MTRILTGTADVTSGSNTIVWHGAILSAINCPVDSPVSLNGAVYYVLALVDTTHIQLTRNYVGATTAGVPAEISAWTAAETQTSTINQRLSTLLSELSLLDANGRGLFFHYQGFGNDVDPGSGNITLDNVDLPSVTSLFISNNDANGYSVDGLLAVVASGSVLVIRSVETSAYVAYSATANFVDGGAYKKGLTLTYVDSDGVLSVGEDVGFSWIAAGAGQAFIPRGDWSNVVSYGVNNLVQYSGYLFASNVNGNLNHQPDITPVPTSDAYWTYIALPATGDFIDLTLFAQGVYGNSDLLFRYEFAGTATFAATLPLSKSSASVGPQANCALTLERNGVQFGTINFAAGVTEATFTAAADTIFTAGNVLTVHAPAVRDPLLQDVSVTLRGSRDGSLALGQSGVTTIDFGAFPGSTDTSVVVTGIGRITGASLVQAWLFPSDTTDHSIDEHTVANMLLRITNVVAGVGFTIVGVCNEQSGDEAALHYGQWNVAWQWI